MIMDRIVAECFKNPVKLEIYMRIKLMKHMTAQQLLQVGMQVPPATLYRNLNRMLEDGILKVEEERKVRGVREKVYAIALEVGEEEIGEEPSEDKNAVLSQIAAAMSSAFRSFALADGAENENSVPKSIRYESVYATDEEMENAAAQIEQIIEGLKKNDASCGRKKQVVSFVMTPLS